MKKENKKNSDEFRVVQGHRLKTIERCTKCNGQPIEEKFDLPTMEGYCCSICKEVLGWKKK